MKPLLIVVVMAALLFIAGLIGSLLGDGARVIRMARRQGWTKQHHQIYEELVKINNKLIAMQDQQAFAADPLLMSVVFPAKEGARIRELLNLYRKEKGID